jgi:hypothetical protein
MPKKSGSKPRKQQKQHQGSSAQQGGSSKAAAAEGSSAAQADEWETLCTPLQRPASQKLRTATHCQVRSHQLMLQFVTAVRPHLVFQDSKLLST